MVRDLSPSSCRVARLKVGLATPVVPSDEVQRLPEDPDSLDAAAEASVEVAREPGRQGGLAACMKACLILKILVKDWWVGWESQFPGWENFASGGKNSRNQGPPDF